MSATTPWSLGVIVAGLVWMTLPWMQKKQSIISLCSLCLMFHKWRFHVWHLVLWCICFVECFEAEAQNVWHFAIFFTQNVSNFGAWTSGSRRGGSLSPTRCCPLRAERRKSLISQSMHFWFHWISSTWHRLHANTHVAPDHSRSCPP